ncbi:UDP-N-acetylmuramoyl-tripeptide--D-alanyl-D-alanine ligase [Coraliomargarita sp. SDUM461004]|uniref:UDP-N-acetylmuramoyl-tripeptide--D-alanyl-D-alanine ligase n=1 Tax=Thalassobacterium sedimentorum TaxID=3041258 RepID=A0ABU1AIT1_9BACT|nr:UDP-N-acetylmuramoyl-tripeptide--D-alanyl-D-alanine ligase [Coraliomargarita sp. SDUM461004]MDQ8194602.1 UDP-N-acetylmuramoyl-tripeptide--D-alanyl-D-alanine ligase [Coraliomargarita sp. SDUM461004]
MMPSFEAQRIADWTGGTWLNPSKLDIEGFCFDARQIKPGQCFVALSGGGRDGHDFVQQAAKGGAVAALVERIQPIALPQLQVADTLVALAAIAAAVRSQYSHPVVGITGSCGKTSTKEMLRLVLGSARTHATAGNWNNRIGVPMTLFGLDSRLQDFAVIEAGINQPDEMLQLGQMIQADLCVVTNIGHAHLELLGSMDNVATEKSFLVQCAKPDSPVVLPAAALAFPAYAKLANRVIALLKDGQAEPAVVPNELVRYSTVMEDGYQLLNMQNHTYRIASLSHGMASNAALAIVSAKQLGISESEIEQRIASWRPAGNRGRIETLAAQTFYIDCYNANPSSMIDALGAFIQSVSPDLARIYVMGAMNELGVTALSEHERLGRLLSLRECDRALFVGPEPLTSAYQLGALSGGAAPQQIQCFENIEKIKSMVAPFEGAIFLKGSRSYRLEELLPPGISS